MRIICIRHGETPGNAKGLVMGNISGRLGMLDHHGIKQSEEAAKELRTAKIDAIYSSPMERAVETAKIIARHHMGIPFILADELKERDFGDWDGKRESDVPWNDRWNSGYRPGNTGETPEEYYGRVKGFLKALFEKYPDGEVLLVGHASLGRVLGAIQAKRGPEAAKEMHHQENAEIEYYTIDSI